MENLNLSKFSNSLYRNACGRGEPLGALYNIHTDQFVHGNIFNDASAAEFIHTERCDSLDYSSSFSENIKDRSTSLNLSWEMALSIFSGLVPVTGSLKFINEPKSLEHSVTYSVTQQIRTVTQSLNFYDKKLPEHLALKALDSGATHVVWKITKGVDACMSVNYQHGKNSSLKDVKGMLEGELEKWVVAVAKCQGSYQADQSFKSDNLKVKVFADINPPRFAHPTNLEQAMSMMKTIHETVISSDSEGVAKEYGLLDLRTLAKIFNKEIGADYIYKELSIKTVQATEDLLKTIEEQKLRISWLNDKAKNPAISKEIRNGIEDKLKKCVNEEKEIKMNLMELLPKVRAGDIDAVVELAVLPKTCVELSAQNVDAYMAGSKAAIRGINLYSDLNDRKAKFISCQGELNRLKRENQENVDNKIYILFFSLAMKPEDENIWFETLDMFLTIRDVPTNILVAVNKENSPDIFAAEKITQVNRIAVWSQGVCKTKDFYAAMKKLHATNFAFPLVKAVTPKNSSYENVVYVKCRCPNDNCNRESVKKVFWYCFECKEILEYDLERQFGLGDFECDCGSRPADKFMFKCGNDDHGTAKNGITDEVINDLVSLVRYKQVNILIIGESGVGKTTFINSTACYTTYPTLAEAERNDLIWLIPFIVELGFDAPIRIGQACTNERLKSTLKSSTKSPRCHYFKIEGYIYCLIDTPGIGDTRGIKKDKQNMRKIMDFLKSFKKLHLICFLMKPDNTRLDVNFEFCFKELVMQFHRSALQNFVFCFTHGNGVCYQPGATVKPLQELLGDIKQKLNVRYDLVHGENLFIVDNFSYRYLALTLEGNVVISDRSHYDHAYTVSSRVIHQIMAMAGSLRPHCVDDSLNVNKARDVVVALSDQLAKIGTAIRKTKSDLDERHKKLKLSVETCSQLEREVEFTITKFVFQMVRKESIVCLQCKALVKYTGIERLKFVEADPSCEDPFYIYEGPSNIKVVDGKTICTEHGSDFKRTKSSRTFYSEQKDELRRNPVIEQELQNATSYADKIFILIKESIKLREELTEEDEAITDASARFGIFLKNNTLVVYNDKTESYLEACMLNEENNRGCGTQKYKDLTDMLLQYQATRDSIEYSIRQGDALAIKSITLDEIMKLIEELKDLEHYGNDVVRALEDNKTDTVEETPPTYYKNQCNPGYGRRFMKWITQLATGSSRSL